MAPFALLQHRLGNFLDRQIFKLPCIAAKSAAADQQTAAGADLITDFGQQWTIMRKRRAGVVRRINVDALDLARKFLLQRLKRQQVIAENQPVIENIIFGNSVRRMVRLRRIFDEYSGLQLRPVLLADPGEFEFILVIRHRFPHHRSSPWQRDRRVPILALIP